MVTRNNGHKHGNLAMWSKVTNAISTMWSNVTAAAIPHFRTYEFRSADSGAQHRLHCKEPLCKGMLNAPQLRMYRWYIGAWDASKGNRRIACMFKNIVWMIQLQVHLQLPCYDFTFFWAIPFAKLCHLGTISYPKMSPSNSWYSLISRCDGRCVQRAGT